MCFKFIYNEIIEVIEAIMLQTDRVLEKILEVRNRRIGIRFEAIEDI